MRKVVLYFAILGLTTDWLSAQILDTIVIGNRVWMAKNLDIDKYANGDTIRNVESNENWEKSVKLFKEGAWCFYNNKPENGSNFGRLYNWYAVADPRGLCPTGWHVANEEDWKSFLNSIEEAQEKIKQHNFQNALIKDEEIFHPSEYKTETYLSEEGGYVSRIRCSNCINWNKEYMAKVPCHKCKDNRWVNGPFIPKKMVKKEREVLVKEEWYETIKAERPPMPKINIPNLQLLNGGYRYKWGSFYNINKIGFWWINDSVPSLYYERREREPASESFDASTGTLGVKDKLNPCNSEGSLGLSVRCVKGKDRIHVSSKNPVISFSLINQKGQSFQSKEIISESDFILLMVSKELFNWYGLSHRDYDDFETLSKKYKINIYGIAESRIDWDSWLNNVKIISQYEDDPKSFMRYPLSLYSNKIKSTNISIKRFFDSEEILNKRGGKYFLINVKGELFYEGANISDLILVLDNLNLKK